MKPKIYIDGKEGTTGLQIYERLGGRDDIDLLLIEEAKRKDTAERKKLIDAADIVFLCLPDDAAREAVALAESGKTRIIDASTAHRTHPDWAYGFAELSPAHREAVAKSARVANPGCHATGFLAAAMPLVQLEILPKDYPLTCYSLTGYSGGGKSLIAEYEDADRSNLLDAPNIYALNLTHKHLPEMQKVAGLAYPPVFSPILGDMYEGMAVTILLSNHALRGKPAAKDIHEKLAAYYAGQKLVQVQPFGGETARLSAGSLAGYDHLELVVSGHAEQTMITAVLDNLGKGASGAAVQNMNLMLGLEETTGLRFRKKD